MLFHIDYRLTSVILCLFIIGQQLLYTFEEKSVIDIELENKVDDEPINTKDKYYMHDGHGEIQENGYVRGTGLSKLHAPFTQTKNPINGQTKIHLTNDSNPKLVVSEDNEIITNYNRYGVFFKKYPYGLTDQVVEDLDLASGYDKITYLSAIQEKFNTTLCKHGGEEFCLDYSENFRQILPADLLKLGYRFIVTIGDSISEETGGSLAAWANGNLKEKGCNHHGGLGYAVRNTINAKTVHVPGECCSATSMTVKHVRSIHLAQPVVKGGLESFLKNCPCKGIIWGGNGLWELLKGSKIEGLTPTSRSNKINSFVKDVLDVTPKTTHVDFVWQSTGSLDQHMMTSNPPRNNFDDFHPYMLQRHLIYFDESIVEEIGKQDPTRKYFYFPVAKYQLQYPGIRCDGMHFNSDFKDFHCRRSQFVVDGYAQASMNYIINGVTRFP